MATGVNGKFVRPMLLISGVGRLLRLHGRAKVTVGKFYLLEMVVMEYL